MSEKVESENEYDSDVDPSFVPNSAFDLELDYDEYSDGEVPEEELKELVKVRLFLSCHVTLRIVNSLLLYSGVKGRKLQCRRAQEVH